MLILFEWDPDKDAINQRKHSIPFAQAQRAFADPHRFIETDVSHSTDEKRFFCYGAVDGEVLTVRFTLRGGVTRIIGAGLWRKGKRLYEKKNPLHRSSPRH